MKACISTFSAVVFALPLALTIHTLPAQAQQNRTHLVAQAGDLDALALEFINHLIEGNYVAALQKYDQSIRTDLTAAGLQQGWQDVLAVSGSFQRLVDVDTARLDSPPNAFLVIVTCEFEQGAREFFVVMNNRNQIISISPATGR